MADLLTVANVKKIIDIGMAIKEAVQTARSNEKECRSIERVVGRVCGLVHTLSVCQAPMLRHPIVEGILDDIWESLNEALVLVGDCGKKHSLFQFVTAKSTAKKISRVQKDILQKVALGTLAITTVTALALSRPQLSGHLQIPFPCNSRFELALQLRTTYTSGEEIESTWIVVNDQTRMTVAFAMKAAGADILIQENNELFAIGPTVNHDILDAILEPVGVEASIINGFMGGDFDPHDLSDFFLSTDDWISEAEMLGTYYIQQQQRQTSTEAPVRRRSRTFRMPRRFRLRARLRLAATA